MRDEPRRERAHHKKSLRLMEARDLLSTRPYTARELALKSTEDLKRRLSHRLDEGDALGKVAEAWFKRQLIEFDYLKPGGPGRPGQNLLEVYFLEIARTNLGMYVIGYERGCQALRTYKLSRMRQMVQLLKSEEGIRIYWSKLLRDLLAWNHEGKPVQQKWARAFYRTVAKETEEGEEE